MKENSTRGLSVSCHCGGVRLELPRSPRTLTQCNCSICRRYGALWAYFRRRSVRVQAARGAFARYRWGNAIRDFIHCKSCGCVTHYEHRARKPDGTDTLAVNVRNADDPELIARATIKLLDGAGSWKFIEQGRHPDWFRSPRAR